MFVFSFKLLKFIFKFAILILSKWIKPEYLLFLEHFHKMERIRLKDYPEKIKSKKEHLHLNIILRGFVLIAHTYKASILVRKIYIF